jgi:hypothetical protein
MRGTRTDAGTTTNKDLDTGGYNAKTCEAIAAMTEGKESQAKREAVPPQAGHGYMQDVRFVFNVCVLYFIGHKPDISIEGGWAY